jgi:hypothetical protein
MKIYLRILGYAPGLAGRLVKFFLYSLLGVAFSAAYLGLIMPMMKVLFDPTKGSTIPPLPEFSMSIDFATGFFNHHFIRIIVEHGRMDALAVCVYWHYCVRDDLQYLPLPRAHDGFPCESRCGKKYADAYFQKHHEPAHRVFQ